MYTYGYNQNLGIWLASEPGVNKAFRAKIYLPRLYPGVNDTGTSQMQSNHKIAPMHCYVIE
jgi:hypothetical protein